MAAEPHPTEEEEEEEDTGEVGEHPPMVEEAEALEAGMPRLQAMRAQPPLVVAVGPTRDTTELPISLPARYAVLDRGQRFFLT